MSVEHPPSFLIPPFTRENRRDQFLPVPDAEGTVAVLLILMLFNKLPGLHKGAVPAVPQHKVVPFPGISVIIADFQCHLFPPFSGRPRFSRYQYALQASITRLASSSVSSGNMGRDTQCAA